MNADSNPSRQVVCPDCDTVNRVPLIAGRLRDAANCGRCKQPLFTGKPVALSAANFAGSRL